MAAIAVATPAVTAFAAYQSSMTALERKITDVRISMAAFPSDPVGKADLSDIKEMLRYISETQVMQGQDIARIKGLIEKRK